MPRVERTHLLTRRRALAAGLAGGAALWAGPVRAAAEPRWVDQRQIGPFVCRAAFPLDDRLLAEADLVRLEQELRRVLALKPCQSSIELLLLRDARQHKQVIASRHPSTPYRRALFYKQGDRSVIFAYRHSELAIDLRHEGTHALLHADLPMVPLWLDEGLAEYFEPRASERPFGPDHLNGVLKDIRRGGVRSLRSLESKHELAEMTGEDYRYAWAWTHFLLHGPSAASMQLWAMLAALRRYEPPAPMSERLAAVVGPPERALVKHFHSWVGVVRAARKNAIARG
ncbi:hypothetical protein MalM25_13950 [Planctomycetes bacterium MalM25]|nr:hypothetical protein MalM25_13950 [Planctomycetes bacterium MalM25]